MVAISYLWVFIPALLQSALAAPTPVDVALVEREPAGNPYGAYGKYGKYGAYGKYSRAVEGEIERRAPEPQAAYGSYGKYGKYGVYGKYGKYSRGVEDEVENEE